MALLQGRMRLARLGRPNAGVEIRPTGIKEA